MSLSKDRRLSLRQSYALAPFAVKKPSWTRGAAAANDGGGSGARNDPGRLPVEFSHRLSRRRALAVIGAVGGVAMLPQLAAAGRARLREWRGAALGAPARIVLEHPDGAAAARLFDDCAREIARLEREFSLHRNDSALRELNRRGRLDAPSLDMVRVLRAAQKFGALTDGAFDITVQPLWTLYAGHFYRHPDGAAGPDGEALAAARALVDYRALEVSPRRVALEGAGRAVTLNGIAQGYITDRVAEILRDGGIADVLVDLGETRASGRHPEGRPWAIGLADPGDPATYGPVVELVDRALATSGGYGTRFSADGRHHHLFAPDTGESANHHLSVSVVADDAMTADALSTGLFVAPPATAEKAAAAMPEIAVHLTDAAGERRSLNA